MLAMEYTQPRTSTTIGGNLSYDIITVASNHSILYGGSGGMLPQKNFNLRHSESDLVTFWPIFNPGQTLASFTIS